MLSNRPVAKGMMFGGCSFTWGQGLYYYSNLDTLREPLPDHYDQKLLTQAHFDHMKILRFPRLVANHFKTWEVVHPWNSGSNYSIIQHWNAAFTNTDPNNRQWTNKQYEYSEISHFVFQLTQHHRDNFIMEVNGKKHNVPFHEVTQAPLDREFSQWLSERGQTLDQWMDEYIQGNIDRVYTFLKDLEDKGIKTVIMVWPNNYMNYVTNNAWLKERLISFDYKGQKYSNIQDMMLLNRELEIKHDTANFVDTPKDHHPSLLCHQVMAQHVIDKIESL